MPNNSSLRRSGRTQFIVLGVLLVVLAAVAIWFWTRPSTQPSVSAGRDVAERFLQQLLRGDPEEAWSSATAEFKSAQGQESFVREVKSVKFLQDPMDFVSVQAVEVAGEPRSEFLFRAKSGETVRLVVGREDGRWKVDRWLR